MLSEFLSYRRWFGYSRKYQGTELVTLNLGRWKMYGEILTVEKNYKYIVRHKEMRSWYNGQDRGTK